MNIDLDKNDFNYWRVSENTRDIYQSDSAISSLIDFERVLDEIDVYAFENWEIGELVSGPKVSRYFTECIFMWPKNSMPDPRAAKRLIQFDCKIYYKKTTIEIPVKIKSPDDFEPGTKLAKKVKMPVWFVKIRIPKSLMSDIRVGMLEIEGETVDLGDLEKSYEEGIDENS